MPSYKKCVENHCKACAYSAQNKGSWRMQVTICPVRSCELFSVRPITTKPIPLSVRNFYNINDEKYSEILAEIRDTSLSKI